MIAVIMATYNRADTLPRAIDSVLRQSHRDWELLIVDDGSTDATPMVLEALVDPRIHIYRHPENRGVGAAKNTGLDHISGEWFTTLDSDDEMIPEALEVMLASAERTGAAAITCNGVDAATGQLTGSGPTADGWLTPEQTGRCRVDYWGLTRTSLLGELSFDERVPNHQAPVGSGSTGTPAATTCIAPWPSFTPRVQTGCTKHNGGQAASATGFMCTSPSEKTRATCAS